MAAQEINTEGKEIVNDDFMKGFGIESTSMLDNSDLANFLDSEESVIGSPENINSASQNTDTPPPPPPKKYNKPDNSGKSKDQIAFEQRQVQEQEIAEKEKALQNIFDDTIPDEEDKKKTKAQGATTIPANETTEPNEIGEQLAAVAKEFYRLGLFAKDTEDEDESALSDPNKFVEKAQETFKKGTEAYLDNLLTHYSPKNRELFFATYNKGVDPATYLNQLNKIESYEKMDLKLESNQELVVAQSLRNQDWEEEDIKDQIAKLKSYSELEDTATKYHKGLVKAEKAQAKELEIQAEQEEQRKTQIDEDYDNNLRATYTEKLKEKDFDGLPITDKAVAKAYDFAYNKKWELNNALLTDFDRFILDLKKPENHAVKAKLALLFSQDYDPNKPIKVDFSKIQKKAVSNESKALFQDLANKSKGTGNRTAYSNVAKSFFD